MTIRDYLSELRLEILRNDTIDNKYDDDRVLYRILNNQRSLWLKNEMNKGRSIEDNIKQTINGLEVEVVDASTFPLIDTKYRVLRTLDIIPKTIERLHSDTITQVRNSNLISEKYNYTHRDKFVFSGNGRFNKDDVFATLYNQHIYIKIPKDSPAIAMLTHISVEGVFEDPKEPYMYTKAARSKVYDVLDEEYPLSLSMWNYIKGAILQSDFKVITNIPQTNTVHNSEVQ